MAAGPITRLATGAGCVAAAVVLAPTPARAAGCELPPRQPTASTAPYVQQLYAAEQLTALATGAGIRVAVIDSGVDASHPQLTGRTVDRGRDLLRRRANGRQDCKGHGTEVASIIAARPVPGTPFHGLAPGATIVPIRVSERIDSGDGTLEGDPGSLSNLAEAIRWAADPQGGDARVINLSLSTPTRSDDVCRAVTEAVHRNVVVVAAVGNAGATKDHNPTPYPAACPNVIGVGAVTAAGERAAYSGHGDYVDLVAPGDNITAVARRGGHTQVSGTSAAAPLVSATVALILQRFQGLTPAEVTRRLVATADPAPGGSHSAEYGYGVLNPYRALTETLAAGPPPSTPPPPIPAADPAEFALQQRRAHTEHLSRIFAGAGVAAVLIVVLAASIVRHGRRRGWQPGKP